MIDANPYVALGYQVLKVETHLHTLHSDGQHSVTAMFESCRSAGYEAVALTDHNTLSGLDEALDAAPVAAGDVPSTAAAARHKPSPYVYVLERSLAGGIDGLRQRRLFASAGPQLDFWLEDDDGRVGLVGSRPGSGAWTARVSPPAAVREIALADGRRCLYAEQRSADQRLEAITA